MKDLYNIYLECVKKEVLSYDDFLEYLERKEVIKYKENKELIGFSIIKENEIEFIGIKEEYRKHGFGTKLLTKTEENLREKGYNKILLNSILSSENNNFEFFEKKGYEDIYINSDFIFDETFDKENKDYKYLVNDYKLFKDNIKEFDIKKLKEVDLDKDLLLCVDDDNKLLGYLQYSIKEYKELGNVGVIENVCILPIYQDLNIEEALIYEVKAKLLKENISKVVLTSIYSYGFRSRYINNLYLEHVKAVKIY